MYIPKSFFSTSFLISPLRFFLSQNTLTDAKDKGSYPFEIGEAVVKDDSLLPIPHTTAEMKTEIYFYTLNNEIFIICDQPALSTCV